MVILAEDLLSFCGGFAQPYTLFFHGLPRGAEHPSRPSPHLAILFDWGFDLGQGGVWFSISSMPVLAPVVNSWIFNCPSARRGCLCGFRVSLSAMLSGILCPLHNGIRPVLVLYIYIYIYIYFGFCLGVSPCRHGFRSFAIGPFLF
jgi:hypothetical protein